jgi:hypothetical protein
MLAFYMDHHVHRGIIEGLRRRGVNVLTAFEDGSERLDDDALLLRATTLDRVLFTQDQDFLEIVPRWQTMDRPFAGVVYAVQQHIDIGRTIDYLGLIAELISAEEIRNRIEYVPSH